MARILVDLWAAVSALYLGDTQVALKAEKSDKERADKKVVLSEIHMAEWLVGAKDF